MTIASATTRGSPGNNAAHMQAPANLPPPPRPKRRRRPNADSIWSHYLRHVYRLRDRLKEDAVWDPEIAAALELIEPFEKHLWAVRQRRQLAEAIAGDKQVLWEVFHPATKTPLARSIFDRPRHAVRWPNTHLVEHEYMTRAAQREIAQLDPDDEFKREMATQPFDAAQFSRYARDIDESLRRTRERQCGTAKATATALAIPKGLA